MKNRPCPSCGADELISRIAEGGMSLRDWFAGKALEGILAGGFATTIPHDDVSSGSDAAFFAYIYADAMLAERQPPKITDGGCTPIVPDGSPAINREAAK